MSGGRERSLSREEEDATVRLLRVAGPRAPVSTDRAARVRSVVRAEWQARRRRHVLRRRFVMAAALVGAIALAVLGGRVAVPDGDVLPLGETIAVVDAVEGTSSELQPTDVVRVGQWIEAGPESRLALRFGRNSSVRIDRASRLRAISTDIIELVSGAIYLDTGQEQRSFEIRTAMGTARNLGTQFEIRIVDESLRLRVRTGIVELKDRTRSIAGRPGTEILLSAAGAVTRPIAPNSPEWAWVNRVAPPLEMEGVTLASFLSRVAREHGWTVEYGDIALAREAERIVLHGSVSHLTPHDAVEVAIATSGLRHRLTGGSLQVLPADPALRDTQGRHQ